MKIEDVCHIYRVIWHELFEDQDYEDFWSLVHAQAFYDKQVEKATMCVDLVELQPHTSGSWVYYKTISRFVQPS